MELWNRDVNHAFGILRTAMWFNGTWPEIASDFYGKTRWAVITAMITVVNTNLLMDVIFQDGDDNMTMETVLFLGCFIIIQAKHVYLGIHAKRLKENVSSAIEDWWNMAGNKEWRGIMVKNSDRNRKFVLFMLVGGCTATFVYIMGIIVLMIVHARARVMTNNSYSYILERRYIIPLTWLKKVDDTQYLIIFIVQCLLIAELALEQCWCDCFYFIIVMHLRGQFEILSKEFGKFGEAEQTETTLRKKLNLLIGRHCRLIKLTENLQISFAEIILFQLGMCATILAIIGTRVMLNVRNRNEIEVLKTIMIMVVITIQTFLYIYAADSLTRQSEHIFYTVYESSWYNLPRSLVTDLTFVIMRSGESLHLRGGKFFRLSRSTMIYIINTTASYISVLHATMKD